MKKYFWLLMMLFMGAACMNLTSCTVEELEELIDDNDTLQQYRKDIIGLWCEQGTQEYWRFKSDGSGSKASPSTGKYWDESEDVSESEADPFQWYIESTGLMVVHSVNGSFSDPDPEAPFKIMSLTSAKMTWKGSDGTYRTFDRK